LILENYELKIADSEKDRMCSDDIEILDMVEIDFIA